MIKWICDCGYINDAEEEVCVKCNGHRDEEEDMANVTGVAYFDPEFYK